MPGEERCDRVVDEVQCRLRWLHKGECDFTPIPILKDEATAALDLLFEAGIYAGNLTLSQKVKLACDVLMAARDVHADYLKWKDEAPRKKSIEKLAQALKAIDE